MRNREIEKGERDTVFCTQAPNAHHLSLADMRDGRRQVSCLAGPKERRRLIEPRDTILTTARRIGRERNYDRFRRFVTDLPSFRYGTLLGDIDLRFILLHDNV